jgi:hypothetical protein
MSSKCSNCGLNHPESMDEIMADLKSGTVPDWIRELVSQDPLSIESQMDEVVAMMLGRLADKRAGLDEITEDEAQRQRLRQPTAMHKLAETMAADLMFREDPAAIAYAAQLMTQRYQELLIQWSTLYATVAAQTDLAIDLDAAQTPEQKLAVQVATALMTTETK